MNTKLQNFEKQFDPYLISSLGMVLELTKSKDGKSWLDTYIESNNIHRQHVIEFYKYISNGELTDKIKVHDFDKITSSKAYMYAFAIRFNLSKNKISLSSILEKMGIKDPSIESDTMKLIAAAVDCHRSEQSHHAEAYGTKQYLMKDEDILEAVSDWLAVALEIGSDPSVWFRAQCESEAFYFGTKTKYVEKLIRKGEVLLYALRQQSA